MADSVSGVRSTTAAATSSPQCGMRNSERHGFGNGGMREQDFVDFPRRDFFSAAVDQFLDASGKSKVAVFIEISLIAGSEPAIGKRFRIRLGIVLILADDVGSLNDDFAALALCARGSRRRP